MNTHNICFYGELTELSFNYHQIPALSVLLSHVLLMLDDVLQDVEANTVRLKEHGQDVLVLEKIPTNTQSADGTVQAHYK